MIKQKQKHRLIGLVSPAIVAEIWIHTDINDPSSAEDIIRLNDDYNYKR